MSADNKSGKLGEIYVAQFLKEHGYIIIDMNYKTRFSEIDIIARDTDGTLCFIEVKTRKSKLYGSGSDFIFKSKMEKMMLGARAYISQNKINCDVRFDVIEVYGEIMPSGFCVSEINHIKNAFYC